MNDVDKNIIEACERRIKDIMSLSSLYEIPFLNKTIEIKPFFASIRFINKLETTIMAENGSIERYKDEIKRFGELTIRVGDYEKGCGTGKGEIWIPQDNNPFPIERHIWELEDEVFKEALKDYEENRKNSIGSHKEHLEIKYFSKENPATYYEDEPEDKFDAEKWKDILREVSESLIKDDIFGTISDLTKKNYKRYLINSEGTRIVDHSKTFRIELGAGIEYKGILLKSDEVFNEIEEKNLPDKEKLKEYAEGVIKELHIIKNAPQQNSGIYPTIIDGMNHSVIWHEAIGHGLEAERADDEENTSSDTVTTKCMTFKGKIGDQLTDPSISVYDDPTDENLNGHYKHDAEGVPGQRVALVKNGILENFLHSRETAGKFWNKLKRDEEAGKLSYELKERIRSNGHARTYSNRDPLPRMANIVVESEDNYSIDELKEMLFEECRKSGLEYGIMLKESTGGEVDLENCYFHIFPKKIFRLYTDGRMERVKGCYIVDTPLNVINNIKATSNYYEIFRGYCDAESGLIPNAGVAPYAFVDSMHIEPFPREFDKTFSLPTTKPPKRR